MELRKREGGRETYKLGQRWRHIDAHMHTYIETKVWEVHVYKGMYARKDTWLIKGW